MYKILPLFKSHYSLGKSILTLEKPTGSSKNNPVTIFDLILENKLDTLVLVEDNLSGLLQASQYADDKKIKLIFGLRLDVNDDMTKKDDQSLTRRAKYIIFAKDPEGYKTLLKIWSVAAKDGFYYSPCIDFPTLKKLWNDHLKLVIPFYDSFLDLNFLNAHAHVPAFEGLGNVVFLTEDNDLPFDDVLRERVEQYCKDKFPVLPAQSIFYTSEEDFLAYIAFRCVHNRGSSQKATLDKPDLEHMGSDKFSFERWLKRNAQ